MADFMNQFQLIFKILIVYILIVLLFVHQSVVHEIADKKGLSKLKYGLLGLLPFIGFFLVWRAEKRVKVSTQVLKATFRFKELFMKFVVYLEMTFMAAIVIIPVIYIVGSALAPTSGLPRDFWPSSITFDNFKELFSDEYNFTKWYWNTFTVAVLNMIATVLLSTFTAYVFARFKFKGKKIGLLAILVLQMFPSFLALIAIYTLFDTFGLLNNPQALVIIYATGAIPFNTWLIKGYLQNIPKELDESAMIDGANKLQIFAKIILPLSVPILTFVAVGAFMGPWMDYILPSFLIEVDEKKTLAVGLFEFITSQDTHYTLFAAGALIVAVPIAILYLVFQRYLIEGITAGANKG